LHLLSFDIKDLLKPVRYHGEGGCKLGGSVSSLEVACGSSTGSFFSRNSVSIAISRSTVEHWAGALVPMGGGFVPLAYVIVVGESLTSL
jgi:hypothetical protein